MDQVGPGGSYFGEKHTVRHFRDNWRPTLLNRGNHDQWVANGGLPLDAIANRRVLQILNDHQPEPLPSEVVAELDDMEQHWLQEEL
jgi:trimethylamine--corrinoid protein Co-methyltransferase